MTKPKTPKIGRTERKALAARAAKLSRFIGACGRLASLVDACRAPTVARAWMTDYEALVAEQENETDSSVRTVMLAMMADVDQAALRVLQG
jgi:hypothetical protein